MVFGRKKKGKNEVPELGVPPNATVDPKSNRSMDGKGRPGNVISVFKGELDLTEDEYIKEQLKTSGKIQLLRRDNERILRKQEAELGMTVDMVEELKISLEKTKTINQKLYEDMEESKSIHDKLESELKATRDRFMAAETTLEDMKNQTSMWNETKTKLVKSESRVRDLHEANKKLRFILMSNHIDHTADARNITTTSRLMDDIKLKPSHTIPKITRRQLSFRPRDKIFNTIQEARQMSADELKKKYGISPIHLDQISSDYLGFYLKRKKKAVLHLAPMQHSSKDLSPTYRAGITLPRIETRKYDRLVLE